MVCDEATYVMHVEKKVMGKEKLHQQTSQLHSVNEAASTKESMSKNQYVHIETRNKANEMRNSCEGQRTMMSAKQMNKLLK